MVDLAIRSDLAVQGVRVDAPVRRQAGAGPSDDGHVSLAGKGAALPVNQESRFSIEAGSLLFDGESTGVDAEAVRRPAFYDLETADGVAYHQLARLHGTDVLATTVIQTCTRYDPQERCRFCAIEATLEAGLTTRVKTPAELAEVAAAAVRLDGVRHMVMTTGTTASADRGARYLARCAAAVVAAVPGLPIQVQCEPPEDPRVLGLLHAAGVTAVGIHVESLDQAVRERWTPGKAAVPIATYERAWREAVALFGRNRVSTYLLIGLGEDPDELVAGAARLADMGVYPFVVPVRVLQGTLAAADGVVGPSAAVVADITGRVASHLRLTGMVGADQGAGCAACGACSALSAAGA